MDLPYNAIHSPMQATPKHLERFGQIADEHRRIFAAMLSALDDSVGAVLASLRQANLEEQTLIFFLGDNSRPPHEQLFWRYGPQGALRSGNWKLYLRGNNPPQLFDLSTDLAEQNNLAEKQPAVLEQLRSAWKELNAQMAAPLWGSGAARKAKGK